jgi:hypothetical protein
MRFISIILITFCFLISALADDEFDKTLEKLVLKAKVLEVTERESDKTSRSCNLKIETTFTNEGKEAIIILKPIKDGSSFEDFMFSCGISIYGNKENGYYWIERGCALPSNCGGCNENLAKLLDQNSPPEKYTKILKPKESFTLVEEETFGLSRKKNNGMYGWDEIEYNNWKIAGDISYSMFPINLGKYKSNFGYKLQKRWKKYGVLYVGGTHSLITSEKFEIDLTSLKF